MSALLEPRRFNVTEYYRMLQAGILKPDDRVELIEGEVIKMSPIGSRHAACLRRLDDLLRSKMRPGVTVSVQSPVRLSDFSEPEPDVALITARGDYYESDHPTPDDTVLIIEVADTTLLTDRNIKVPLYARSGVPEVWLVNLPKELIEVYYERHDGTYLECRKFQRGEVIVSPTVTGLSLSVNEVLG
jgi:Uma2 family endonuclease